jgi:hypothetical protein
VNSRVPRWELQNETTATANVEEMFNGFVLTLDTVYPENLTQRRVLPHPGSQYYYHYYFSGSDSHSFSSLNK